MSHDINNYVGYFAAFLTTFSFLPQALKTIKTKSTNGISPVMYSAFTVGSLMWFTYGLLVSDVIIVVANSITFAFALIILSITVYNLKKGGKII